MRVNVVVGSLRVYINVHDFGVHIHVDVHGDILCSVELRYMLVVMRHLTVEMTSGVVPSMLEMVRVRVDLIVVVGLGLRLMVFEEIVEVYEIFIFFCLSA